MRIAKDGEELFTVRITDLNGETFTTTINSKGSIGPVQNAVGEIYIPKYREG